VATLVCVLHITRTRLNVDAPQALEMSNLMAYMSHLSLSTVLLANWKSGVGGASVL
jgi:hypothetical protein